MNNKLLLTAAALASVLSANAQAVEKSSQNLKAAAVSSVPLIFRTGTDIANCNIPAAPIKWGMDVAWNSSDNVRRGTNYIGKDVLSIGRVSFQPSDLVDANGNLSATQQRNLQSRLNNISISGIKDINLNCDHEVLMNKDNYPNCDQNYANYNGKPVEWYRVIKATMNYCRAKGFNVISVSPFNEPDYTAWKEGTKAEYKEIARLISEDPDFEGVRICAGNTLNCDQALSWYTAVKPYVNEGNTHQLAGSFDTYAKFWETVKKDGNYGTADELHNTMEAFVAIHYGAQAGIWWGYDGACRGEFCRSSFYGKEVGYAENRSAWSAGTVYKREDGRVDVFLGTSERQATPSAFEIINTDRPVYYNGYGPTYNYEVELPGGTGYQKGQTNGECMVNVAFGEDVPPMQLVKGKYVIVNRNSNLAMGLKGGAQTNGTPIVQVRYSTATAPTSAQWIVDPVSNRIGGDFGYVFLRSERSNSLLIDMRDWSTSQGGEAIAYQGGGGAVEQWALEYAGNGDYYIRCRHSGLYLEVKDASTATNAAVQQAYFTGKDNQKWHFMLSTASLDTTAPAAPQGLTATPQSGAIRLSWEANKESDIAAYEVLRADAATIENGGGKDAWDVIGRMVSGTEFMDNMLATGTDYIYKVKALDKSMNRSEASATVNASTVAEHSLMACYGFNENANDATANGLDASVYGTTNYSKSVSVQEGTTSLNLNNSRNNYILLPRTVGDNKEMTISMWIYNGSSSKMWARIFDFGNGTDQYMFLTGYDDNSKTRLALKNGGEEQTLIAPKLSSGDHHITVTIGKENVSLYIDGKKVAETSDITIRPSDFHPVNNYIGRSQFASDPLFSGYIDDLRIYNYALTDDEVAEVFAGNEPTGISEVKGNKHSSVSEGIYTTAGLKLKEMRKGVNIVDGQKIIKK